MDTLPYWKIQFQRKAARAKANKGQANLLGKAGLRQLLSKITDEGPLSSRDFKVTDKDKLRATWSKPAHKQTLDHLWLTGGLAVSKRKKFIKYYDLAERIYPQKFISAKKSDIECINWLASHAIDRLGFATDSEIQRFWDAFSLDEAKYWSKSNSANLNDVSVELFDGKYRSALMSGAQTSNLRTLPGLSKKIKILNPFDPLTRDRDRLMRLFGFDYRIEMYVPEEKRKYGYYVYPLLEFDTFVGRLEVRHDRKRNVLCIDNLWPETNVKFGKQRMGRLKSELDRMRKFCKAELVEWSD